MDGPLMRKINGKVFLLLLLGSLFCTGTVFAVHYFQYQRIGKALLFQAERFEEQGQLPRAAHFRQRYLEFNPRDVEGKAKLAQIWAGDTFPPGSKQRAEAIKLLDEILRHEENPELRRLLVKTAVAQRDFKIAREHLSLLRPWEKVQKSLTEAKVILDAGKSLAEDRDEGEIESYWGQVFEADKKPKEAISCYRVAIRHAPELQLPAVRLAYLLRRDNDPANHEANATEADRVIDGLVARNASSYEAYLARWRYRRDFDLMAIREAGARGSNGLDLESAAEDVKQALKRQPESLDVLLAAADLERLRGRVVSEGTDLTAGQRQEKMKEHRAKALELLQRGLDVVARKRSAGNAYAEFQLLWHKGNLLLDDLDTEQARRDQENLPDLDNRPVKEEVEKLINLVRRSQMPAAADYMRGRLLVHEREWAKAVDLFERAQKQLESQPDLACQANLYLGRCYERLEQHTLMYAAYQRVVNWDPTSVPALMGMASARWGQKQYDNAIAQFELLMKQDRVPPRGWIDVARLEMQKQGQLTKPDWTRAEAALKNANQFFPEGNLDITLLEAEILLRKNKVEDAVKHLEAARDKNPNEPEYWTALIDLALQQKNSVGAKLLLEQAREKVKDHVSLRLAEARILVATSGKKASDRIAAMSKGREKFTEREQGRLLSGLAEVLFRLEQRSEARALWQTVAKMPRHANDIRLQQLLFDLAMRDNDTAGMEKVLADIRTAEGSGGTYARYGEALYLIWQAKRSASESERASLLQKARQHVDAVARQRPSWPPVFLARAEIAELNGNPEQSIKDRYEAMRSGDTSPETASRLAGLLIQRNRGEEAKRLLAQSQGMNNRDLNRFQTIVAIRRGELTQAVEFAQQVVKGDSKELNDLVWMGTVLAMAKKPEEAEKKLREAVRLYEKDPLPHVTLVQMLVGAKRKKDALAVVAEMKSHLPADKLPLALARSYDAVGDPKQAAAHYQEAFEAAKRDPATLRLIAAGHLQGNRAREAEAVLRHLLSGKVGKVQPDDLGWAKRSLAMLLAASTDYQRFLEAVHLVGLKFEDGRLLDEPAEENTDVRRARARVLASQNQQQCRKKAIAIFEDLDRIKALSSDDEFILAVLYEKDGDVRKAELRLKALTDAEVRTPRYVAQYAMTLLTHRREADALEEAGKMATLVEEMEKQSNVAPNTFASVDLRARLLEATNKGDEAVKLLQGHVRREGAKPEEVVLLLGSLQRQKRYDEALKLCEQTWKEGKCLPEVVGAVSVALLHLMNPTDAQVASIQKHLEAAIKAKPGSSVLVMHLASFHDRRGNYDKAAELYRKILSREPNNVVALNNLAWLLAVRDENAGQALVHINKAVNGMGRRADLLDTRGMVHLKLKDTARAVADLEAATKEAPTPMRLYHYARALHEDSNRSRAREVLRQAKEKGLQVTILHPTEQDEARKFLQEYGLR